MRQDKLRELIKARLFELKKISMIRTLIFGTIVLIVSIIFMYKTNEEQMGFDIFVGRYMASVLSISIVFAGIITIIVCVNDYLDKTVNFCILNGYTRTQVYFSRVILSVVLGLISFLLIGFLCLAMVKIAYPGEHSIPVSNVIVRLLFCIFPMFRIIGIIIFFAFIIKNPYAVAIAFMAIVINLSAYLEFVTNYNNLILGINGISSMFHIMEYSTYRLSDKKIIYIFNSNLDVKNIVLMIVVSLAVGIFFIMLGYSFHKEDDYDGRILVKGD